MAIHHHAISRSLSTLLRQAKKTIAQEHIINVHLQVVVVLLYPQFRLMILNIHSRQTDIHQMHGHTNKMVTDIRRALIGTIEAISRTMVEVARNTWPSLSRLRDKEQLSHAGIAEDER